MKSTPFHPDFDSTRRSMAATRIGSWVLHPDLGVLRRGAQEERLNAKTLHVLMVLLEAGDRGVSRTELLDRVWGSSYPSDAVVSRAISDLRNAFDERGGKEKYFRTLPKFGYQLVAEVEPFKNGGDASEIRQVTRKGWLPIILSILLVPIAYIALKPDTESPMPELHHDPAIVQPLTSAPGLEHQPRLVPGGDWVVYAALRSDQQDWDLFRVDRTDGISQPIAVTPGLHEHGPAVSPTGEEVAYVRLGPDGCQVVSQSLVLGVPRVMASCTSKFPTLVDWSGDGRLIAFTVSEADDKDGFRHIHAVDKQSGKQLQLTRRVSPTGSDFYPRFSPDNRRLAFMRGEPQPDHRSTLWLLDIESGEERRLTSPPSQITGMTWLDAQHVFYGYFDSGRIQGGIIDIGSGDIQQVDSFNLIHPEYDQDENILLGARQRGKRDLFLIDSDGAGRFIAESTDDDYQGSLSPDEGWIAFVSRRSGYEEIWLADTASGKSRRLTRFDGATVRYPDWHPAGERIVFSVQTDAGEQLFEVDIRSGDVKPLDFGSAQATTPKWLADGESVVFGCQADGDWAVCVGNPSGMRVVAEGFHLPQPLAGNEIAAIDARGSIFRISIEDGSKEIIFQGLDPRAGWAIKNGQLVFVTGGDKDQPGRLLAHDLDTGTSREIFEGEMPLVDVSVSIGKSSGAVLLTRQQKPSDDLVLLKSIQFQY